MSLTTVTKRVEVDHEIPLLQCDGCGAKALRYGAESEPGAMSSVAPAPFRWARIQSYLLPLDSKHLCPECLAKMGLKGWPES